jgi:cytoskeletal protein RodZ
MICHRCGNALPEDAKFCFVCGAQQVKEESPVAQAGESRRKEEKGNKRTLAPLLLIAVVIVAVLGGVLWYYQRQAVTQNTQSVSAPNSNSGVTPPPTNSIIPGDTSMSAAYTVTQQFSQDLVNKDYQAAYNLLTPREQASYHNSVVEFQSAEDVDSRLTTVNINTTGAQQPVEPIRYIFACNYVYSDNSVTLVYIYAMWDRTSNRFGIDAVQRQ